MRYRFNEFAPSGKRQYSFLVGKKDIEILYYLAIGATGLPNISELRSTRRRIKSLVKGFAKALAEAEELGDDGDKKKLT